MDLLSFIRPGWIEQNIENVSKAHKKIKNHYWVCRSGEDPVWLWRFGTEPPKGGSNVWSRPSLTDTLLRAAIFDDAHKTRRINHYADR